MEPPDTQPTEDTSLSQTTQGTRSDEISQEIPSPSTGSQQSPARSKLPPAIAPKPVALRRSSLPSPAEQTFPSSVNRYTPGPSQSAEPPSPAADAFQKGNGSTSLSKVTGDDQEEDSARPSVKSMVSSWGQQPQTPKYGDKFKDPPSRNDGYTGEIQPNSIGSNTDGDTQANESPGMVVPQVLNPPTVPMPQPRSRPITPGSERRRSSISNRYSSIILPPLKEVPTPESSLREQTNTTIPTARDLQQSMTSAYGTDKENEIGGALAAGDKFAISGSHNMSSVNDSVSIRK